MDKAFRPFICNRGDCAITGFSTAEALESVSPHVYPKDVVVLTVAFLCGPLPVEAVESTLETLIDAIDFLRVEAIKRQTCKYEAQHHQLPDVRPPGLVHIS